MPILTVELVGSSEHTPTRDVVQALADAIGRALNSPPGQTWVRLRVLPHDAYAENGAAVDEADMPVFVTVLARQPPMGAALQSEVTALTSLIAQIVGRPSDRVHLEYTPAAVGRVSFGGKLVQ